MTDRIAVVGGGFGGLWAAASAARARAEAGKSDQDFEIVLISPDPFHTIRVRCYESDLGDVRVPLDDVLAPINVRRIESRVTHIDPASRRLMLAGAAGAAGADGADGQALDYSRLVVAPGSALAIPPMPISCSVFDVDTYDGAMRLDAHLDGLKAIAASEATDRAASEAARTVVVIGGGLVGIELACELPKRLHNLFASGPDVRVVLLDRGVIGGEMGEGAPLIGAALAEAGVDARSGVAIARIDADAVTLNDGARIATSTVIFATGMKASPLMQTLGVACDRLGRLPVDKFLQVEGLDGVYAAGDCASALADDDGHRTVMSCQHARPMGRLAGNNAACDLMKMADQRVAFFAPDYVTILDLGPVGALYTEGWERGRVVASGSKAKAIKQTINGTRIYPPLLPDRDAIFAAAAPNIQTRPAAASVGAATGN